MFSMKSMSFALSDGRNLSYGQEGQGGILVLLHGWNMRGDLFRPLIEALSDCCRVLVPDLPGYGASSLAPLFELDQLCCDLGEFIAAQNGPVRLCGWSLGGQLAMALACSTSYRVRSLCLISSTPRFCQTQGWDLALPESQLRALKRQIERDYSRASHAFFRQMFCPTEAFDGGNLPEVLWPEGATDLVTAQAGLDWLAQVDLRHKLKQLKVPTLIIHGSDDQIIPFSVTKAMEALLPQSRLLQLDNCGHAPFLTRTQEVAAALKEMMS